MMAKNLTLPKLPAANPMIEMLMKSLGLDGAAIAGMGEKIGAAFEALKSGQAEVLAKLDRQTEMLLEIQIGMGIANAPDVSGEMADFIAEESRKFMGRTIMSDESLQSGERTVPGATAVPSVLPDRGTVEFAYVKLEEILKIREGVKLEIYLDSVGRMTAGIGHLLTPDDGYDYDEGDPITQEQCDAWFRHDAKAAMDAAMAQMKEAGITSMDFLPWLASVNFQLGIHWPEKFPTTWGMIMEGDYSRAADHLATTAWAEQTPVRVADFARALRALPPKGTAVPVAPA